MAEVDSRISAGFVQNFLRQSVDGISPQVARQPICVLKQRARHVVRTTSTLKPHRDASKRREHLHFASGRPAKRSLLRLSGKPCPGCVLGGEKQPVDAVVHPPRADGRGRRCASWLSEAARDRRLPWLCPAMFQTSLQSEERFDLSEQIHWRRRAHAKGTRLLRPPARSRLPGKLFGVRTSPHGCRFPVQVLYPSS